MSPSFAPAILSSIQDPLVYQLILGREELTLKRIRLDRKHYPKLTLEVPIRSRVLADRLLVAAVEQDKIQTLADGCTVMVPLGSRQFSFRILDEHIQLDHAQSVFLADWAGAHCRPIACDNCDGPGVWRYALPEDTPTIPLTTHCASCVPLLPQGSYLARVYPVKQSL